MSSNTSDAMVSMEEEKMPPQRKLLLQTADGKKFVVAEEVAFISKRIQKLAVAAEGAIQIAYDINSRTMAKVLEYCKKHAADQASDINNDELLKHWDDEFVNVDFITLHDLHKAAYSLEIHDLGVLTAETLFY